MWCFDDIKTFVLDTRYARVHYFLKQLRDFCKRFWCKVS